MKIVAFAGGVGGAKFADGLSRILPAGDLTIIVNTGDDFEHYGLSISPDLDTVCYTLAGLANPKTGWGRADDTYHMLSTLKGLGGDSWFTLGDKDLAVHLERTHRLRCGFTLTQVTREFCKHWRIEQNILPMSDGLVQTQVDTVEFGALPFQSYFVQKNFEPRVKCFRFRGIESALPAPGVLEAIVLADAIVICPSNPWVSIDPILGIPGIRSRLMNKKIFAVSPIVAGKAIKGPLAKMFLALGINPSAIAVYHHYSTLLSGFIFDEADKQYKNQIPIPTLATNTIIKTQLDRKQLAKNVLDFIQSL